MFKKKFNFKRIIMGLFVFGLMFGMGVSSVLADSAPSTLSITHKNVTNPPITFPETFHVKSTTSGKYVYCMTYSAKVPVTSITYSKSSAYTDPGVNYLLEQGYKASNDTDYFIAQTALWIYMMDKGIMNYSPSVNTFKTTLSKTSNSTSKSINNLVSTAKSKTSYDTSAPTISIGSKLNFSLSSDGKYYTASVKVTSSTSSYEYKLSSAPSGSTISKSGNTLTVKVPVSSITTTSQTVKITVSNSKTVYTSYKYKPSNSKYQTMAATYPTTKTASANVSGTIASDKVTISKQDITNKEELPGAELVVKDSSGNVVDSWTSTTTPHEMSLAPGKYTLSETTAPDGYELSTETISFEVGITGVTTKVVMYNSPKETVVTKVSISKQDVTTGEELPGAKLEVLDSDGNVIESWTSTTTPHIITGLEEGTYTLRETTAPDGYEFSTEEITFVVEADNAETVKVVMYNSPEETVETEEEEETEEVVVPSTSSFKTMTSSMIGIIVLIGGSVLITKNLKKHED